MKRLQIRKYYDSLVTVTAFVTDVQKSDRILLRDVMVGEEYVDHLWVALDEKYIGKWITFTAIVKDYNSFHNFYLDILEVF